jgi:hypothetical protein
MPYSDTFVRRLQARTAMLSIGASTLRNQGAPGVVHQARQFLSRLNLERYTDVTRAEFMELLARDTDRLKRKFPGGARNNWGAARKAINIFMGAVCYSRPLSYRYRLARLEPWLEVPLDKQVYDGLLGQAKVGDEFPHWPGIRFLDRQTSDRLQAIAAETGRWQNMHRICLDVMYWRATALRRLER